MGDERDAAWAKDPTERTLEQQRESILNLEKLLSNRIEALEKTQGKFEERITKVPTEVQKEVGNLKELHDQRFDNIDTRFNERDRWRDQVKQSQKEAIEAAFLAAKQLSDQLNESNNKAVDKVQIATTSMLKQLQDQLAMLERNVLGQVGDVKERVSKIESRKEGRVEERQEYRGLAYHWVGIIGAVMMAVSVVIAALTFSSSSSQDRPALIIERQASPPTQGVAP